MPSAKDIEIRPVTARVANDLVKRIHYSGGVKSNSQLHLGVYLNQKLEGALQYGPSIDIRRMARTVTGSGIHDFMELNRMAFSERLPPNSESRALAVSFRLLREHAPQIKWVVSFADATVCGDGGIYRAAGFHLVHVKRNTSMLRLPDGTVIANKTLSNKRSADGRYGAAIAKEHGATPLPGFQIKYVKFIDPAWEGRLATKPLPYSAIRDLGATMYRGQPTTVTPASEA